MILPILIPYYDIEIKKVIACECVCLSVSAFAFTSASPLLCKA